MHSNIKSHTDTEDTGELCNTLFHQGILTSQTQLLKYVGPHELVATTGQRMWCTGANNRKPLDVVYSPHIGTELGDIDLDPFKNIFSYFNPFTILSCMVTWRINKQFGAQWDESTSPQHESVAYHVPNISQMSVGQSTDIAYHKEKYLKWKTEEGRTQHLILWGVSRGTAATFCAYTQEKYPEVKLVVLEGAIDSVQDLLSTHVQRIVPSTLLSTHITQAITYGLSFFNRRGYIQYDPQGPSPLKSVDNFPEGTPVVFITSKKDAIVPCEHTRKIAHALADRGKNHVYLLELENSSHPNYMFDDDNDRTTYETFIHAIYKKYQLKHNPELAITGEHLLDKCALHSTNVQTTCSM